MNEDIQQRINRLSTTKSNLKNKIQTVLGKNLSNVRFEDYYKYITPSKTLNPTKTYTSVSDTIAGKLIRLNEVKHNIKEVIEKNFGVNLDNIVFEEYYKYIREEYTIKSLKEPIFYQGWKYRVQILLNDTPVGSGVAVSFLINGITYNKTTDKNGIAFVDINLNPGTYTFKVTCQNKTFSEKVVVTAPISVTKTARTVTQGSVNPSRGQTWIDLTPAIMADEEPTNYASCNYIAGKNGTRHTPYYVDFSNFGFSLPNGAIIKNIQHRTVMRLNHSKIDLNGEFDVKIYTGTSNPLKENSSHTLLANKGRDWQYFTPSLGNIGNYNNSTINSSSFKTRVQFFQNKIATPCAIAFTHYRITIIYIPKQNI